MNTGSWDESLLDPSLSFLALKERTGAGALWVCPGVLVVLWSGQRQWGLARLEPAMGFRWLSEASF